MFSLRLLGGAVIEGPQGPLGGRVSQRRRVALLSVLALSRDRAVSRDRLLALFWPERDSERARHSLADSVYQIRKALGENAVLSVAEEVRLNAGVVSSDVRDFEDALARGDRERAVALYDGPFLDGFHLSDAPEFERWVDGERDRLTRACAKAIEQLAEQAAARGNAHGTAEWWRRLAGADPYNARITLRLMEALEAAGDRAGALQQARIHAALLEQEFAAEPDPAVEALAERLRSGPVTAPRPARDGADPDAEAPAPTPFPAGADSFTPVESASIPETAPPARTRRRHVGWTTAALLGACGIGLAAVLTVGWLLPNAAPRPGTAQERAAASPIAIAVLPCANWSRDPEEEYFSDGLTEELIGTLSRVRALQVVARTSTFAFKGENRDVREIGTALNVGTLLQCSVRRAGERVRIMAQLINAADGFHLWAETYEREGTDIFAIQNDLALHIVSALEAELTPAERVRLAHRPTTNPEAHVLYQKGRYFWNQRSSSGYARAIEYYERAIDVDPLYAAAYAGLAMAYSLQGLSGDLAPHEARERMREAVLKALELDDGLAEAHAALGAYLNVYEWESDAAEAAFRRAIELDPSGALARHLYGNFLHAAGRSEEAIARKREAIELDPLAPQLSNSLGTILLAAGHPEQGLEHIRNALELDSTFWPAHANLGSYYETTGRFEQAILAYQRAVELEDARPSARSRSELARVLALAGREDEARGMLGELEVRAARTGVHAPAVAELLLALGDVEDALEWLEQSYRQRHPGLRFISRGDGFARLDGDPRFVNLLRRIGFAH